MVGRGEPVWDREPPDHDGAVVVAFDVPGHPRVRVLETGPKLGLTDNLDTIPRIFDGLIAKNRVRATLQIIDR